MGLLGCAHALSSHPLLPLSSLLLSWTRRSLKVGLACTLLACAYTHWRAPPVTLPQEKTPGEGIFHIEQARPYSSFFNRSLLYKGTLFSFVDAEGTAYPPLPCHLYLPLNDKSHPATTDYAIRGVLSQPQAHRFCFKPEKKLPWTPVPSPWNLAEWRFRTKQTLLHHLKHQLPDPSSCTLLYALISGEVDERILSMEMSRVGLQHLLAVSGFHFALLSLFVYTLLRLLLPEKLSLTLLLFSLLGYYLFVGESPAIQRAFIAILLVTLGRLSGQRLSGLNALGIGLIIEILLQPLNVLDLGFQFSFLCTGAILLLHPGIEHSLRSLLPKRNHRAILAMPRLDQHAYLLTSFFRSALSLNCAVHLASIPVLLFLFHKFPCLSFFYNLIFPACIALSMILLFSSLLLDLAFPCLGTLLHLLNTHWTKMILHITSHPPAALDFCLRSNTLSLSSILLCLLLCFLGGILLRPKQY